MGQEPTRVRYDRIGAVGYVTIDRPHVLNAMDQLTHVQLGEIWDDFEADDALRVAVLTGAGERAFSAGQDLKELATLEKASLAAPSTFGSRGKPGWPRLTERFALSKPIVARVNGLALGGGFELVLACDIVIAAETAEFGLPEPRVGLVAGGGGIFRLARQAPLGAAMGYLLTGRRMDARRAYELGLVNEVVPASKLDDCVKEWVTDILACAPLAVRAAKEAAYHSVELPLEQAFYHRYMWEERRMHSIDAREGPAAFAEKRKPCWQGR
jgi:dehydration protein DpgD